MYWLAIELTPHFGVGMAILGAMDISRGWCKLSFESLRGLVESCHFPGGMVARRQYYCFLYKSIGVIGGGRIFIWQEDWVMGYHSMGFKHFPNVFQFPKILSLKPFGKSWRNSYIPCFQVIIVHHITCGERNIWWNIKVSKYENSENSEIGCYA